MSKKFHQGQPSFAPDLPPSFSPPAQNQLPPGVSAYAQLGDGATSAQVYGSPPDGSVVVYIGGGRDMQPVAPAPQQPMSMAQGNEPGFLRRRPIFSSFVAVLALLGASEGTNLLHSNCAALPVCSSLAFSSGSLPGSVTSSAEVASKNDPSVKIDNLASYTISQAGFIKWAPKNDPKKIQSLSVETTLNPVYARMSAAGGTATEKTTVGKYLSFLVMKDKSACANDLQAIVQAGLEHEQAMKQAGRITDIGGYQLLNRYAYTPFTAVPLPDIKKSILVYASYTYTGDSLQNGAQATYNPASKTQKNVLVTTCGVPQ